VFAGVNGVLCVDVKGSSVLSNGWDTTRCARGDRQFIAKIEMAMKCRGVVGREVGVKPYAVEEWCVLVRSGVRS